MSTDGDVDVGFREKLDRHRDALLARIERLASEHGRVLYDGRWLAPDRVRADHRRRKWKSRLMVLELGLAVLLVLAAAAFVWTILLFLLGGR